ncbi:hypothetical protein NEIG_00653 [Nematocida sp. ERTm5]|nr:hypothetical protein NEIG_00653 [Nematocida sp. ERTm5]
MFYAVNFLSNKGKLSAAWVAAYFDRRLSKSDIQQVDIEDTVNSIESGDVPELALRTSSHILLGLSKILFRKTKILYDECKELFICVKKKEPSDQQPSKLSKKKITYSIDIFKHMVLPNKSIESIEEEIEEGRGSIGGMVSFQDYSFSLNNISLSLAETISEIQAASEASAIILPEQHSMVLEDQSRRSHGETMQLGVISIDANLSAISIGDPSVMLDTILNSPVKLPRKRQESLIETKRQKIDQTTEIDSKCIKVIKQQAIKSSTEEAKRSHLPIVLQGIYASLQKMHSSIGQREVNMEKKPEEQQSIVMESTISELPGATQNLFSTTIDQMPAEASNVSIEVPRGGETTFISMPGADMSFMPQNGDLSNESILVRESLSTQQISEDLLSSDRRTKAQAFMHLLRRVTDGSICVSQESPYGLCTINQRRQETVV